MNAAQAPGRVPGTARVVAVVGVLGVLTGLVGTGCSATLEDVPLPGTGVPGETIMVTAEFDEALNLARGAPVRVNGVESGKVRTVEVDDFRAQVRMELEVDADVRRTATARLRYTTPLGELFVDVTNPERGVLLDDGDELSRRRTATAPTVEDALAQASLLVNGGGLAQLQTVTDELNLALGGREDTVRALLERSATAATELNATTADIDRALRSLDSLARTLRERDDVIERALREIRPAARVLRRNTPGFTRLLREVEEFARVAGDTVEATREDLLSTVRQVGPVLGEFASNRDTYAVSLRELVALGDAVDETVPGDYLMISLALRLDELGLPDLADLFELIGLELLPGLTDDLLDDILGGVLGGGSTAGSSSAPSTAGSGALAELGLTGLVTGS